MVSLFHKEKFLSHNDNAHWLNIQILFRNGRDLYLVRNEWDIYLLIRRICVFEEGPLMELPSHKEVKTLVP